MNLVPPISMSKFFSKPLQEWLDWTLLDGELRILLGDWPERVAICCWWQWRWRNVVVFNDNFISLEVKLEVLQKQFEEHKLAWTRHQEEGCSQPQFEEIAMCWLQHPHGVFKININGASKGNPGTAGGSCVIKDSNGR